MIKYMVGNNFYGRCGMREFFSLLYGNERAKARLGNAILAGKLPHAFLIAGPEGSGKRTLAKSLAMAVNCEMQDSNSHPLPCMKCNTCRRINDGNFTDITYIKRVGEKATIGVDEVRFYRDDMALSPNESEHKVYIIEEADRLTENAQNALLTVLEEPPRSVIIILICESQDKILTTIKSRVQTIAMQRFEFDDLKSATLELSSEARLFSRTDPNAFNGLIMSSDGRIGKALKLFSADESKKSEEDRLCIQRIVNAISRSLPYKELYTAISELPKTRVEFSFALESLICAIRDLILAKFDKNAPLLFYTSRDEAFAAAKEINIKKLLSVYEAITNAQEDARRNVTLSAVTADLSAKIKLL